MPTKNETTNSLVADVQSATTALYVALATSTPEQFGELSDACHKLWMVAGVIRQDHDDRFDTFSGSGNLPESVKRIRKARESSEKDTVKPDKLAAIFG